MIFVSLVHRIKKRNEDQIQLRLAMQTTKEMEIQAAAEKAAAERDERRRKLEESRRFLLDSKRKVSTETREQGRYLSQKKAQDMDSAKVDAYMKADEERARLETFRRRKATEAAKKEQEARLEYTRKIEEESKRQEEANGLIELLEKEERDLIERLKKTQRLQSKVSSTFSGSTRPY
jgi:hypothetical protein